MSLGTYDTEPEARRSLLADLVVLEEQSPTLSVADWTSAHLDARELGRELRDVDGQRSLCRAYLAGDVIGEQLVSTVRRADVVAWTRRMRARGLARSTVGNALTLLRGSLQAALNEGHAKDNAATGVRLAREARSDETWRYLDMAGQGSLIAAAGPELGPLVSFAIATGVRAGELCALRLADVSRDAALVRFGGPPAKPTKSGKPRAVPLLPLAQDAVEAQRRILADRRPNPHGLLWPAPRGGFRQPKHVLPWADWRALVERAGVSPALRWHDLRHTCASSLVAGWWDRSWTQLEVRAMLGHGSSAVTEKYMHLHGSILDAAAHQTRENAAAKRTPIGRVHGAGDEKEPRKTEELTMRDDLTTAGLQKTRIPESQPALAPIAGQLRDAYLALLMTAARGDAEGVAAARARLAACALESPLSELLDAAESTIATHPHQAPTAARGAER